MRLLPVSHEAEVSWSRPTGVQIYWIQLQVNDICEVIEALDDSNAVKKFTLKKVDGLGTELRPFDDPDRMD